MQNLGLKSVVPPSLSEREKVITQAEPLRYTALLLQVSSYCCRISRDLDSLNTRFSHLCCASPRPTARQSGVKRKDAKEEDEGTQKGGVAKARLLCDHIQEGAIIQAELADDSPRV